MMTIDEALKSVLEHMPKRKTEFVPLEFALNRVLAESVRAVENAPRFNNSAMDGFACRWEDISMVSEVRSKPLRVIGEAAAGVPFSGEVKPNEAVRISTGALIPPGADVVVPVEEVDEMGETVLVCRADKQWNHIRFAGEEIKRGEKLVESGTLLGPEHLALMASQGIAEVQLFRRPVVSILTTGSELKSFDSTGLNVGEIRNSNSIMLQTALKAMGISVEYNLHVHDSLDSTQDAISHADKLSDVIILTGGISVGPHDHVKAAARANGFKEIFWKIAQKPGKPFFFAAKKDKLLFGLPGNPVSAFMGYVHYIYPLLCHWSGRLFSHTEVKAILTQNISIKGKRPNLLRVTLSRNENGIAATPLKQQGSHMITSIARAQGYIRVEPGMDLHKNETIKVYLFPWRTENGIY